MIEKKVSVKVSGKVSNAKKTLTKTVPKPFALSTSKRHNVSIVVDDVSSKDSYVPLKAQVDNFFDKDLRQSSSNENSDSWVEPKNLTKGIEPNLMSAERGRLRNLTQELLSTEDKILEDIKN